LKLELCFQLEWLVKAVGAENPWKHADAELLDSITVAGLLKKVTFTDSKSHNFAVISIIYNNILVTLLTW